MGNNKLNLTDYFKAGILATKDQNDDQYFIYQFSLDTDFQVNDQDKYMGTDTA